MQIVRSRPYHARVVGQRAVRMPDGKSVFKIYFVSVIGRENPERYEWAHSPQSPDAFVAAFRSGPHEGAGFVLAFPHITKVFRFSPFGETVIDVTEYDTRDLRPKDCSRGDGSHEFACYAESVIAAAEHEAWAAAPTVETWLGTRCERIEFPVATHTKMETYWNQRPAGLL